MDGERARAIVTGAATVVLMAAAGCGPTRYPPPTIPAATPGPSATPGVTLADRVRAIVAEAIAEGPAASLSVAVAVHGQTVEVALGEADVATHALAGTQTRYEIGSITKQFTAAAVMRLAEQGRLGIDDPLARWLPELAAAAPAVTLRHLLTHTSGLHSYTDVPELRDRPVLAHAAVLDMVAHRPPDFPPGERWAYSNTNYYLLGIVVERASGQSWPAYLDAQLFAPAGLHATRVCAEPPGAPGDALGTGTSARALTRVPQLSMTHPFAAGALCATASDLVAWSAALAAGRIVTPASFAAMTTPAETRRPNHHPYGFGLGLEPFAGHRSVSHGGGIPGFSSALHTFPDDDVRIAVLANTEGPVAGRVAARVARAALGVEHPDPTVPAGERAACLGRYRFPGDVGTGEVVERAGGRLLIRFGDSFMVRLLREADGRYLNEFKDDVTFRFVIVDGRATEMRRLQAGNEMVGARVR